MKSIIKSYMMTIVSVVILIMTIVVASSIIGSQNDSLASMSAGIADLQSQIRLKSQTVSNAEAQAVQAVTGLDRNRVTKDDEAMAEFFNHIFTWSSYEDYMTIREELKQDYGLTEGSTFLSQFMPEIVDTVDSTGKHFNRIDVFGLNMTFENMETYCTYIKGGDYSYAAFVKISCADKSGNVGYNTFMTTYTTDIDGNILNMEAFAAD